MSELDEVADKVRVVFPELNGVDVDVDYKELEDAFLVHGKNEELFYIHVDTTLRDADREAVEGGLAHEFSHIARDKKSNATLAFCDMLLYRLFPPYNYCVERTMLKGLDICTKKTMGSPHKRSERH